MQIKANIIIRELCENNILPKGQFQIQESHLVEFINTYKRFFSKKKTNILDTANYRFARKMAGVNLLKLLNVSNILAVLYLNILPILVIVSIKEFSFNSSL